LARTLSILTSVPVNREFGLVARLAGPSIGLVLLAAMHREARRLRRGPAYEPPTFYETNRPGVTGAHSASPCRWVEATPPQGFFADSARQ
jgi:tryptophan synthase alpha subunit